MTTIVYREGILAADSKAVTGNSTTYITDHTKITVSKCKRFAYANSSQVIDPEYIERYETLLFAYLVDIPLNQPYKKPIPKDIRDIIRHRDFIIMTKDQVYTRYSEKDSDDLFMTRLLDGEFVAVGTGRELSTVALVAGRTAVQAVTFAIKHEAYTYPCDVQVVRQSSLKPFPKELTK